MTKSPENHAHPIKRPTCLHCLRPLTTCICKHIQCVKNNVELIILQHPHEVNEAKNSARLLHLCLHNSQLHVGEQFDSEFFAGFKLAQNKTYTSTYDLLLYPDTPEEKSSSIATAPPIDIQRLNQEKFSSEKSGIGYNLNRDSRVRLWVLDATWRKSRKMLYVNPSLQTMPRLKLYNCAPTIYTIRKAHSENQLSTLEASCYALQQLELNLVDYAPVLTAFAGFIAQQKVFIPRSHF